MVYMMGRKVICLILLFFIMLGSAVVSAQDAQKTIKIGMDMDYPPFNFFDKTVPVGFNVDMIQEMNRHSPQKMEISLDIWSTVQSNLRSGTIDAASGMLYTEERAKIYDFTIPYNSEPAVIFISRKTNISNIRDLNDKIMADIRDDDFGENILRSNGFSTSVAQYDTFTEVFFNLETGKADFAIVPYALGMEIINKYDYNNVAPMGPTIATYQYRIAVRKGNTEVITQLNRAIDKMRQTDFNDKNKKKWIKYKNDGVSWTDFVKFALYILVPVIMVILLSAVYLLKREILRKTMLLQEQNAELTKLAMLDPGTELYNRRRFYELAENVFASSKKSGHIFGLLMVDIDWFKKINDSYGHDVGDQVIAHFAQECKTYFRSNDVVCRYGGEEFIILLPMTTEERVIKVAERIRELVSEDEIIIPDGRMVKYTISIGIATFKLSDEKLDEIIKRADNALYIAKEQGRNQIITSK